MSHVVFVTRHETRIKTTSIFQWSIILIFIIFDIYLCGGGLINLVDKKIGESHKRPKTFEKKKEKRTLGNQTGKEFKKL